MSLVRTIGGDRLGAGKKQKTYLRNYERSTHDLSELFQSSIAPGVLYPAYSNYMMMADVFEININSEARTLPTIGPMLGAFKLQVDFFFSPARLYNARLHNNPIKVGMQMQNIKFPVADFPVLSKLPDETMKQYVERTKCDPHSLPFYLGMSGFGVNNNDLTHYEPISRQLPAMSYLTYYDIFKNYYANKQEDDFYFVSNDFNTNFKNSAFYKVDYYDAHEQEPFWDINFWDIDSATDWPQFLQDDHDFLFSQIAVLIVNKKLAFDSLVSDGIIDGTKDDYLSSLMLKMPDGTKVKCLSVTKSSSLSTNYIFEKFEILTDSSLISTLNIDVSEYLPIYIKFNSTQQEYLPVGRYVIYQHVLNDRQIILQNQDLSLIDDLRDGILMTDKESVFNLSDWANDNSFDAFLCLIDSFDNIRVGEYNAISKFGYNYPMTGLICKTYQNDIFNTWLNKEFIEGIDSIAEVTKIDTSDGLYMDTLNLAQKVYNMKCQIAVSGGTWDDWLESVYGETAIRRAETPIYCGGQSAVVSFDEIVSNSATDIAGDSAPLGTLGGRGKLSNHRGGKVVIKAREPGILMAIASLTPLDPVYVQGNKWFMTDIFSPDDFHKPALDAIGFQDLIGEQMVWSDTEVRDAYEIVRHSYAKLPAWMNYMTSHGRAYGDFADDNGKSFMVLSRTYDVNSDGTIKDFTAYIDPKKFNYMFANADRDAQNFWLQLYFDVKARRKMSAKIIPNL